MRSDAIRKFKKEVSKRAPKNGVQLQKMYAKSYTAQHHRTFNSIQNVMAAEKEITKRRLLTQRVVNEVYASQQK